MISGNQGIRSLSGRRARPAKGIRRVAGFIKLFSKYNGADNALGTQ
jgi:hypothetical protein